MKYLSVLLLVVVAGCARIEHRVVEPQDVAGPIGRDPVHIHYEPLEYWAVTADGRLVVRIYNPTDETIVLVGGQSTVVAPTGRSHPVHGGAIAPGSFIKLILPPLRPQLARSAGPRVGVGVGMGVGAGRVRPGVGAGVGYGGPAHYTVYDMGDALYWDWPRNTSIRLTLKYEREDETFRHEFVLDRQRERR
jgi:mannose-6-phosphate isomerase-like protein (cupin superfamily)